MKLSKELKILIVDDSPQDRAAYARQLKQGFPSQYSLLECEIGQEGIQLIKEQDPDCILLDYMLPDMNGLEFLSVLNQKGFLGATIMLTGQGNESVAVKAMKGGAHDYLVKDSFSSAELYDTIINAVNSNQNNETKKWKNQALVDSLTKVLNRNAYDLTLEQMMRDFKRYKDPTVLIVADIDHFKKFNDLYGHKAGDNILQLVATSISDSVRGSDLVFRYGGEEFVVLLKKCSLEMAQKVAEKIRQEVEAVIAKKESQELKVTISLGLASLKENDTEESVFQRADQALYKAKRTGRNQVVVC
jgi:diguanylate cyclase (GGDEF)-like protein